MCGGLHGRASSRIRSVVEYIGVGGATNLPGFESVFHGGSWTLLRWQAETAAWVIVFSGSMTFILLKLVGIFVPLRLSDEELEIGDHAIHGNEVYPSDVPTLGGPHARRRGSPPRRRPAHRAGGPDPGRVRSPRTRPGSETTDRGPASAGPRRIERRRRGTSSWTRWRLAVGEAREPARRGVRGRARGAALARGGQPERAADAGAAEPAVAVRAPLPLRFSPDRAAA